MKLQIASLMLFAIPALGQTNDSFSQEVNMQDNHVDRKLPAMTELDCYYECVKQGLSADACVDYIKSVLGEDLSGSQYPDLQIKISRPRPPATKDATYWEIGIPTNIYGEVSCNIKGGTISYRDPWVTEAGPQELPDTNCLGLNAAECCSLIKTNVAEAGIALTDVNGNCLSCWVHQEILTPTIGAGGNVAYTVYAKDANEECGSTDLPASEVQAIDSSVETSLVSVSNMIDSVIENGASCDELKTLQNELMLQARSFHHIMVAISSFLCGKCDANELYNPIPGDMKAALLKIQEAIQGEIKSDENCIVIYADHGDFVMEPPKVGGSRAELDFDRDDPDCNEDPAGGPDGGPGGVDPSDPPPTDPDGYYDEAPDNGSCSPTDLAVMSQQPEDSCFKCRRCLLQKCNWDEGKKCRKIFKFKAEGTPEQWRWCLENNGGLLSDNQPNADGTYNNWCACALKCEDDCVRQGPPAAPKPTADRRCTAQNIANASDEGEKCEDCKACIQENCDCWHNRVCRKLLSGAKKGTRKQWAACLDSNGSISKLLDDSYDEDDGKQDTWSKCSKNKCADRCIKVKEASDAVVNTGPVCTMDQLSAKSSTKGDVCFACRTCIKRKCDYWKDKCEAMMLGEKTGTAAEWSRCMETCGRGVARGRALVASTCECFNSCEDQCRTPASGAPARTSAQVRGTA